MDLKNLRQDYNKDKLDETSVSKNPIDQFNIWMNDALKSIDLDANAMILSTVSKESKPSSRIVLLKDFDENGFTFFTNYESKKGEELIDNPNASLLFYWKELERQIRIEGNIIKTDNNTSDAYFESRPFESRIAAIASEQSKEINKRFDLEKRFEEVKNSEKINRPDYWGGYILKPNYIEFWQGGANRLHDRIVYELEVEKWRIARLAP